MNEILQRRMKRRKFKSKLKGVINIVITLTVIFTAFLFSCSIFAYARPNKDNGIADDILNFVSGNTKKDESKNIKLNDKDFDILTVRKIDYLSDETLDGFEMETKNLKIVTEDGVALDSSETNYIYYYVLFNDVEVLDLSEARFLKNEFTPTMHVPCTKVIKVILPHDIKIIGECAFYEWSNLSQIVLPEELKQIKKGAFSGCVSLDEVNLPKEVARLEAQAFLGCSSLYEIDIPDSVEFIGEFCFAECDKLKQIVLSANENLEIEGLIVQDSNIPLAVYKNSKIYEALVPQKGKELKYELPNKVLVLPESNKNVLKKKGKITQLINSINVGDNKTIDDIVNADISGTGAIDVKLEIDSDIKLDELKVGTYTINYTIKYYLEDEDIKDIACDIKKVDSIDEVLQEDLTRDDAKKYFILANMVIQKAKVKIKVIDQSNSLTKDVKENTEKHSRLLNLEKHEPYMSGFKDNTFRPKDELTNAETAAIISRILGMDENVTYKESKFKDVKATSWVNKYASFVYEKQIMTGYNGEFRPNAPIKKQEFVAAIAKMKKIEKEKGMSSYIDARNKPEEGYILAFEKLGYINGDVDMKFGYNKPINRVEAARIINNVLGRKINENKLSDKIKKEVNYKDVKETNWFYLDVIEATYAHYPHELHDDK